MQRSTHKSTPTVISSLLGAVQECMKRNQWSRETMAQTIIEAHERIGGHISTQINFDPETRDPYERARVNADRIFRWLDEVTKDRNVVPPNFIPSVLASLPLDLRIEAANALLLPAELACRPIKSETTADKLQAVFRNLLQKESGAQIAVANLLDGIGPGELMAAQAALIEDIAASQQALEAVESLIQRCGGDACAID